MGVRYCTVTLIYGDLNARLLGKMTKQINKTFGNYGLTFSLCECD